MNAVSANRQLRSRHFKKLKVGLLTLLAQVIRPAKGFDLPETGSRAPDNEEASLWPVGCQAVHNSRVPSPCRTPDPPPDPPVRAAVAAHPNEPFLLYAFMQFCAPPLPDLLPNTARYRGEGRPKRAWATCCLGHSTEVPVPPTSTPCITHHIPPCRPVRRRPPRR
jgi:hypothetical protein